MVTCKICKKEIKSLKGLSLHIKKAHNVGIECYYDRYMRNYSIEEGFCKTCGEITKFKNISVGYNSFCNGVCSSNNDIIRRKIKDAVKQSYVANKEKILLKKQETYRKKWGVDYYFQSDEFYEKMYDIVKENHGISPSQSKKAKEKRKETNIGKYGVDNPSKSSIIIEKIRQKKHENGHCEENAKAKRETTILERYGSLNYNNREQSKDTCRKKYGVDNPSKIDEVKSLRAKNRANEFKNKLGIYLKELNLQLLDKDYLGAHIRHNWKCSKCNHEFNQLWNAIQQGYLCPKCFPRNDGTSLIEKNVVDFIKSITSKKIYTNDRKAILPKELDIFIPELKIAIEFNGLFWHSDLKNTNKYYHLNKTEMCMDKNIRLIHIFEDEWIFKKDIVKSRIKSILGIKKNIEKLHGRKCVIREIDTKTKNIFLEKNHLQGKDSATIKLGAFYFDELVAVMTFSKGNPAKGTMHVDGLWELNRFCSKMNYQVFGIAGKLLKHFVRNYEWNKIFSYADRRWSVGNIYKSIGFELDKITEPNYWYINGLKRIYRYNLRKKPEESKNIPEWILRQNEGYSRIWDCGHYKYIMKNDKLR